LIFERIFTIEMHFELMLITAFDFHAFIQPDAMPLADIFIF
jgi:hypothetical protein